MFFTKQGGEDPKSKKGEKVKKLWKKPTEREKPRKVKKARKRRSVGKFQGFFTLSLPEIIIQKMVTERTLNMHALASLPTSPSSWQARACCID